MKKKFSLFTIIFVVLSALIAILGLFGILELKGAVTDLLLTCLTLAASGLLTLNSFTMLERKNKLALISLSLIGASALLVIISLWTNASSSNVYTEITLTLCILSVCFNLITSNILKLQNKYLKLQIPVYITFAVVAGFLIAVSWDTELSDTTSKIFILFIILSLLGTGVLAVLSKRQSVETYTSVDYVKISKSEYQELLEIKEKYNSLKGQEND